MKISFLKNSLIVIFLLFLLSITSIANEVRPVLLQIKKAERSINNAELEIRKAENDFRIFNIDQAYKTLEYAKKYLEEAEKAYNDKEDEVVKEFTIKAVKYSLKAVLATAESFPVQARGLWLDSRTIATAGDRAGIQKLLNKAEASGFNMIFPEVFFKGQTIIPSNNLFVQDLRFLNWQEDPLEVIIEESSLRNMEVHAWVWVFNENTHGEPGIILREHPDWANLDKEGNIVTYHNSSWLSPANEEVKGFLLERYKYLVKNYDLDGINLDYIRFPEEYRASYGFDKYTISLFEEKYNINPFDIKAGSLEAGKWNQFREGLITEMLAYTSDILREIDSDLIISADVIPGREEAKFRALQDWDLWLNEGYLDFVLPMTYTENLFDELSAWLREENKNNNSPLYPGISVFKLTAEQVIDQVIEINKINPVGLALFAAAHLEQEHYDLLLEGPFREKAVIPFNNKNEALSLVKDRIKKRIEMITEKGVITEKDRDKLFDNLYDYQNVLLILNEMKMAGKQEPVDILKIDFTYLEKIERLF